MNKTKHLHISGICGTAMAAIAYLALESGWRVTGSDASVYPPMSDYLAEMGIEIQPFNAANLSPAPDLTVIGNALSRGNEELETVLSEGLAYTSGAQFIGDNVLSGRHALVVAGTHGKTTTASLLAHVLHFAGREPGFMIGGIPENFGGGARLGSGTAFVLEGDEYDTALFDKRSKFLHYHPKTLILNNLEFDHADIFDGLEAIKRQFHHLLRTLPSNGNIIVNADDANLTDVLNRGCWTPLVRFARFGNSDAEWQWQPLRNDGSAFCLYRHGQKVIECNWSMIGIHNITNACAAAAAANSFGIPVEKIGEAFASFSGVRRRMTLVGKARGIRIFDDFAHHPTAIAGIVSAAKASMAGKGRLWVVVEPRSNTMRSRIHQDRLPDCFSAADHVVFVPASGGNLAADKLLDALAVCTAIGKHAQVLPDVETIIAHIVTHGAQGDDVLILSNGGFENIHQRLLTTLGKL